MTSLLQAISLTLKPFPQPLTSINLYHNEQIYTWMLAAILTLSCSNLYAQTKNGQVNAFFTTAEMPKLSIVPPPNDTTNARFKYDTTVLSKHARGLAVDLNTLYNPYYKDRSDGTRFVQPGTASVYCDRSNWFPYRIDHNDLAYRLFTEQGFEWGGDWTSVKDYQHFEFKDF